MPSQDDNILAYLKAGHSLTGLDALHLFGSMRLASRIDELRKRGHDIRDEWVEKNDKRFKLYFLNQPTVQSDLFMSRKETYEERG